MYVNHDDASGMSLEKWLDDTKEVMDSHPTDFALIFLIASSSPTWEAIKVRKFSHRPEKSSEALARGLSDKLHLFSIGLQEQICV